MRTEVRIFKLFFLVATATGTVDTVAGYFNCFKVANLSVTVKFALVNVTKYTLMFHIFTPYEIL